MRLGSDIAIQTPMEGARESTRIRMYEVRTKVRVLTSYLVVFVSLLFPSKKLNVRGSFARPLLGNACHARSTLVCGVGLRSIYAVQ
jgi:hypothetical protein